MTRILYIDNAIAIYGGIERVLIDKINWLAENSDVEIYLLTTSQGSHPFVYRLNPKVKYCDLGVKFHQVYQYPKWKRLSALNHLHKTLRLRLSEFIQLHAFDVLLCTRIDIVSDIMKVKGNIPLIFESHNTYLAYKFEKEGWVRRFLFWHWHRELKKARMVVPLTNGDAAEWRKLTPRVQVIPNVVHLNATGRVSDCQSKDAIFVGRYSYQKDIPTLLQIWEKVHRRHPDWNLHLFSGYGEQQDQLMPEISHTNMNIVVHKPTAAIHEEFLKCSMLLMTSIYEPFGLVLPEAMSCGLPVVAFDCPYGPADIITDGVDGFLIKDRRVDDFVEKVCLLMDDRDLRLKMGRAGVQSSRRYAAGLIMPQWEQLFENVIES